MKEPFRWQIVTSWLEGDDEAVHEAVIAEIAFEDIALVLLDACIKDPHLQNYSPELRENRDWKDQEAREAKEAACSPQADGISSEAT